MVRDAIREALVTAQALPGLHLGYGAGASPNQLLQWWMKKASSTLQATKRSHGSRFCGVSHWRIGLEQVATGFRLPAPNRPLKNYLRWQYCVKNALKMLIYNSKLRFFGRFCLVLPASPTFFKGLLMANRPAGKTCVTSTLEEPTTGSARRVRGDPAPVPIGSYRNCALGVLAGRRSSRRTGLLRPSCSSRICGACCLPLP